MAVRIRTIPVIGKFYMKLLNKRIREVRAHKVDWALQQVVVEENSDLLAIGCGDGTAVEIMNTLTPRGKTYAVDTSEAQLYRTRERNEAAIEEGKVRLYKSGGAHLPFDDQRFTLVVAFSCYVEWTHPERNLREVHRVLKNGGFALVTAETQEDEKRFRTPGLLSLLFGKGSATNLRILEGREHMKTPAVELKSMMEEIGFENVTIETKDNWQCVIGGKV